MPPRAHFVAMCVGVWTGVQKGFPATADASGMVRAGKDSHHDITFSDAAVMGSFNVSALVYVTPVGSLMQALEALIQEPCGCFEQTSSTTYPLVMAQMYFKVRRLRVCAAGCVRAHAVPSRCRPTAA